MDASRKQLLHAVFDQAVGFPPDQRERFLRRECGQDDELAEAVTSLLLAHDRAGAFLADPTVPADRLVPPSFLTVGSRIGPYTLLRVLGEGGYGTVYEAQQEHPLRRHVALKVIKAGMDTRHVIARFELERRALAVMDHPNIAKVFDAGATEAGRPYFVMELVSGEPITDYCRSHRLNVPRRLELFVAVCAAVQHAHTKGIIHRDLKPANVLVTAPDGKAVPKVIDFGIAKALNAGEVGVGLTQQPQFLGTPQYMSPEQAQTPPADVDTRSDIYGLGVLLYEMLTDQPPFDDATLRSAAYAEVRRIIREVDPPSPSTRLRAVAQTGGGVTDARDRARQVRGDIDWVVMRAMEKDRDRRYPTAAALAEDVRRFLASEPVDAGPPGRVYRLRKFARRNRRLLAVTAVVIASLTTGMTLALIGLIHARHSTAAEAAQRHMADGQRALALANEKSAEDKARRLLEVQKVLYRLVLPVDERVPPPKGLLDFVRSRTGGETMAPYPDAEAPLRASLGQGYFRINAWDEAERQFTRAAELEAKLRGPINNEVAALLSFSGEAGMFAGHYDAAEKSLRRSIDVYTQCRFHIAPAQTRTRLAAVLAATGRLDEAETVLRDALATMRPVKPPADFPPLWAVRALARVRETSGDAAGARVLRHADAQLRQRLADVLEKPVASARDGSFTLAAGDAELDGDALTLESDALTGWGPDDTALWYVSPSLPGQFAIEFTYSCSVEPGSAQFRLDIGDHTLTTAIHATRPGSPETISLGTIVLPPSRMTLRLRLTGAGESAFPGLRVSGLKLIRGSVAR